MPIRTSGLTVIGREGLARRSNNPNVQSIPSNSHFQRASDHRPQDHTVLEPSRRDREVSIFDGFSVEDFAFGGTGGNPRLAAAMNPGPSDIRHGISATAPSQPPNAQRIEESPEGIRRNDMSPGESSSEDEDDDDSYIDTDNDDDDDSDYQDSDTGSEYVDDDQSLMDIDSHSDDSDNNDDSDYEASDTDSEDETPIAGSRRRANTGTSTGVPIETVRAPEIPMVTPATQELPGQQTLLDVTLGRFLEDMHPITGQLQRPRCNSTNFQYFDAIADRNARATNRSIVRRLNELVDLGVRLHRALASHNSSLVPASMRAPLDVAGYNLTTDQVREDTSLLLRAIELLDRCLNIYRRGLGDVLEQDPTEEHTREIARAIYRRGLGDVLEQDPTEEYTREIARAWSADLPLSTFREMARAPNSETTRTLERERTEYYAWETARARPADISRLTLHDRETTLDSESRRLEARLRETTSQLQARLRGTERIRTALHRLEVVPQAYLAADERQCNICQESYLTGDECELSLKLPCGHIFGDSCIRKWVNPGSEKPRNTCPLCRAKVFDSGSLPMPF